MINTWQVIRYEIDKVERVIVQSPNSDERATHDFDPKELSGKTDEWIIQETIKRSFLEKFPSFYQEQLNGELKQLQTQINSLVEVNAELMMMLAMRIPGPSEPSEPSEPTEPTEPTEPPTENA